MTTETFAQKLKLVLKVLVVSRTGLAAALNVDKSLVGRWVSGAVRPSEHNRAKITRYVAERVPGFTLLDWDSDLASLAKLLGVQQAENPKPSQAIEGYNWIPAPLLEESKRNTLRRGNAYEGLWKSTRASNDLPGRFVHDICLIRREEDGMMRFKVGVEGVRYDGWTLFLQHQLFSVSYDVDTSTMMFSIYNSVARQRPEVLDGINLATLRDAGGSPAASVSVLNRMADLTGDAAKDIEMFETAIADLNPLAEEGTVSEDLANHLTQHVTDGPPGIFRLLYGQSMARGTLLS